MPIKMNCPSCGKTLSAPDTAAGKKAKCPACGNLMIVPTGVFEAEEIGAASQEPASDEFRLMDEIASPPPLQSPASPAGAGPEPGRRPCPECGEMIVAGAAKCRFCNAIFDPSLKVRERRRSYSSGSSDQDLTTGDWIFCILCSGIACIVGIVYAIQGKPKGMKMVGISLVAGMIGGTAYASILALCSM